MNRKTNIFYSTGNDSKFLTFDNYSEALTGDILATDQKLWPSRFICLYVKALDGESHEIRENKKQEFINSFLVPYYENKLAFLRDNIENTSELSNILPLNYLLSLIFYYASKKSSNPNEYDNISDVEKSLYNDTYYTDQLTTEDIDICYISDIIEQDYNGTYADIICTITTNNNYKPVLTFNNIGSNTFDTYYQYKEYNSNLNKLYGWDNDNNPNINDFINKKVIFDNTISSKNVYYTNSLLSSFDIQKFNNEKLKFNVVIPLFDSQYINKIKEHDTLLLNGQYNVPLGMYFTDKPIELESYNNVFNSSWSLLISMQFKAFPFSFDITHNFDDSDYMKEAYVTFAEILAKQNVSIEQISKYNNLILTLQNKISALESKIKTITTVQNIDDINIDIEKFKNGINSQIDELNNKIDQLAKTVDLNKLRWNVKNNE